MIPGLNPSLIPALAHFLGTTGSGSTTETGSMGAKNIVCYPPTNSKINSPLSLKTLRQEQNDKMSNSFKVETSSAFFLILIDGEIYNYCTDSTVLANSVAGAGSTMESALAPALLLSPQHDSDSRVIPESGHP